MSKGHFHGLELYSCMVALALCCVKRLCDLREPVDEVGAPVRLARPRRDRNQVAGVGDA